MEDNIQVVRSKGGTCFKCEKAVRAGETVIRFSFNVNIPLIGKHRMGEEAHVNCAGEFHMLLGQRVAEAYRR
ncbi:MAG: hypothetical protein ACREDF_04090 [Thermoplasmata archaeon]